MQENSLLFLTSFNEKLYNVTGKRLLKSFIRYNIDADFLVTYEGLKPEFFPVLNQPGKILLCVDISEAKLLKDWEEANKDIIPDYYGGLAKSCNCPHPKGKKDKDHKKNCHFTWWNRNCSRWFRKIVTLNIAKDYPCNFIIWIDSDSEFIKFINGEIVSQIFGDADYFYLKGKSRPVDETGLFGFRQGKETRNFIRVLTERYITGKFRYDPRWDDSYQLMMTRMETKIKQKDLVAKSKEKRVVEISPFRHYLKHNKGTHGRILGIMK